MIPRDCKPIGHIPPLPRIDLNPPRSIAQVPVEEINETFARFSLGLTRRSNERGSAPTVWRFI